MAKKERSLTNYTYTAIALHLVICIVIYILRNISLFDNLYVKIAINVIDMIMFFLMGLVYALGIKTVKFTDCLLYAFLIALPISLIMIPAGVVGTFFTLENTASWASFFFVGSTINFYMKPFVFLAGYLKMNAYFVFAIIIAIMFFLSLIGALIGAAVNASTIKRRKTATISSRNTDSKEQIKRANKRKEKEARDDKKLKKEIDKKEAKDKEKNVLDVPDLSYKPEPTPKQINEKELLENAKENQEEVLTEEDIFMLGEFEKLDI